jgi:Spy/CpxP family protein refolding chaperone
LRCRNTKRCMPNSGRRLLYENSAGVSVRQTNSFTLCATSGEIPGSSDCMKKSLLTLALAVTSFVSLPTLASAQDADRRGPRTPEEQLKAMKENLKLSDEQVEKLKPVLAKNQEKVKALREDQSLSQDDRRTKMRELYQGMEEELKPILTPEQQTKWKEEREKRRAQRSGGQ